MVTPVKGVTATKETEITEMHSPPGVNGVAHEYVIAPGDTLDLTTTNPHGAAWDFSKPEMREEAWQRIAHERPTLVVGSPPCTMFSNIHALNWHRWTASEWKQKTVEATVHLEVCCRIYKHQVDCGAYFVHEHPAYAGSWILECIKAVLALRHVETEVSHMYV